MNIESYSKNYSVFNAVMFNYFGYLFIQRLKIFLVSLLYWIRELVDLVTTNKF